MFDTVFPSAVAGTEDLVFWQESHPTRNSKNGVIPSEDAPSDSRDRV